MKQSRAGAAARAVAGDPSARLKPLQQRLVKACGILHLRRVAHVVKLHQRRVRDALRRLFAQHRIVAERLADLRRARSFPMAVLSFVPIINNTGIFRSLNS